MVTVQENPCHCCVSAPLLSSDLLVYSSARLREKQQLQARDAFCLFAGTASWPSVSRYRIDLMKDPTRQMLRLRSMYAEQESDCLLFQQKEQSQGGGLELVETPLAVQHMDKVVYLVFGPACLYFRRLLSTMCCSFFWGCWVNVRISRIAARGIEKIDTKVTLQGGFERQTPPCFWCERLRRRHWTPLFARGSLRCSSAHIMLVDVMRS